ncbi:MAG: peptide-methionine (S)-S-oxide reductase MsrA [Thaumarchaeota archaeon]|nr:peptide-methionine (S)-S-oxide reductase MsrA [Nitrososphaerota archaeon]
MSSASNLKELQVATLGGGCFWCIEAVFSELNGVLKAESGYAGGTMKNPSYEEVCSDETGHAEVVQVTFDPSVITYREILQVFFSVHDPTTLNRQGADVGTQYRSVVFYNSPEQRQVAEEVIKEINRTRMWEKPVVTELVPLTEFYKAEEYHQNYFKNNPSQGYCQVVISPKVSKFRKNYFDRLKKIEVETV